MRLKQRIVVVLYCAALACFFIWVPWSITTTDQYDTSHQRLGYGWIWAGPRYPIWLRRDGRAAQTTPPKQQGQYSPEDLELVPKPASTPDFSDIDQFVATARQREVERSQWDGKTPFATPDLRVIAFQVLAITLVAIAGFVAGRQSQ